MDIAAQLEEKSNYLDKVIVENKERLEKIKQAELIFFNLMERNLGNICEDLLLLIREKEHRLGSNLPTSTFNINHLQKIYNCLLEDLQKLQQQIKHVTTQQNFIIQKKKIISGLSEEKRNREREDFAKKQILRWLGNTNKEVMYPVDNLTAIDREIVIEAKELKKIEEINLAAYNHVKSKIANWEDQVLLFKKDLNVYLESLILKKNLLNKYLLSMRQDLEHEENRRRDDCARKEIFMRELLQDEEKKNLFLTKEKDRKKEFSQLQKVYSLFRAEHYKRVYVQDIEYETRDKLFKEEQAAQDELNKDSFIWSRPKESVRINKLLLRDLCQKILSLAQDKQLDINKRYPVRRSFLLFQKDKFSFTEYIEYLKKSALSISLVSGSIQQRTVYSKLSAIKDALELNKIERTPSLMYAMSIKRNNKLLTPAVGTIGKQIIRQMVKF